MNPSVTRSINSSLQASYPSTNTPFITSWSGGKDGCFAQWAAAKQGANSCALLTMLTEDNEYTSAHGLHRDVLAAQAECLGLPIIFGSAGRGLYEEGLKSALDTAEKEYSVHHMVFGDIDLQAHKDWYEKILQGTAITPCYPLWHYDREQLLIDMFSAELETMIISIKENSMDKRFLGQILTPKLAAEIKAEGLCPTGEEGDFHTLAINGPGFIKPLNIRETSIRQDQWGHLILGVVPA